MSAGARRERRTPRAILFDWDNTLVDNWHVIAESMNAVLDAFGMPPWSLDETKARTRASLRDSFPAHVRRSRQGGGPHLLRPLRLAHLEELREMPGAGDLLTRLKASGLYLGVVSNKRGRFLRLEAEHLGWTGHFGKLVGAADAPQDKPAIAPVELALAGSGIARGSEVWFVGDTDIDIDCAVNAGCIPVLLRTRGSGRWMNLPPTSPICILATAMLCAKRLAEAGVLPPPIL